MHIHEVFMIRSCIQTYKGDTNIYGPLWTLRCIYALCGHFSLLFSIFFLSYFSPKDFIIPHIIDNHMTDFPHHHSIMYDFTPLYSRQQNCLDVWEVWIVY